MASLAALLLLVGAPAVASSTCSNRWLVRGRIVGSSRGRSDRRAPARNPCLPALGPNPVLWGRSRSRAIRDLVGVRATERSLILRYGSHRDQFGVLNLPPGTPDTGSGWPVVILLHGGFWQEQYKLDLMSNFARSISQQRIAATWNVEYRRVRGDGGFPATFQDVAEAVDHLLAIAGNYGLDLKRTVIIGHSAGGHLAAWAALRSTIPKGMPGSGPKLLPKLAILQSGVLDLREAYQNFVGGYAVPGLLGSTGGGFVDTNRFPLTSPIELLSATAEEKPRFVELHPKGDSAVPFSQSERFHMEALKLGYESELKDVPEEVSMQFKLSLLRASVVNKTFVNGMQDHFAFLRTDTKAYQYTLAYLQRFLEPDAYEPDGKIKIPKGEKDIRAFYQATTNPEEEARIADFLRRALTGTSFNVNGGTGKKPPDKMSDN